MTDVIEIVARTYLSSGGAAFHVIERRVDVVAFIIDERLVASEGGDAGDRSAAMEMALFCLQALLCVAAPNVAASGWRGVELMRSIGSSPVPFADLGPVTHHSRRHALLYDRSCASRVVPLSSSETMTWESATRELMRLVEGDFSDRTFSGRVTMLIREGTSDQGGVARALGLSIATLRRRLAEEGQSFRALRVETLRDKAMALLATDLTLAEVAKRLDFADVRSFSRAFKSWTGVTPNSMKKENRS